MTQTGKEKDLIVMARHLASYCSHKNCETCCFEVRDTDENGEEATHCRIGLLPYKWEVWDE